MMNMQTDSLAIFGAKPALDREHPIGQFYFPSWERYEASFRGIFDRQYYTEHGPLVQQLEEKLRQFLGVKHAICVTNESIGFMMLADAMGLSGKVVVPSFNLASSVQSLIWAGIEPVYCDVDPGTHQIAIDKIGMLIDKDVSAIMGANLWGGACDHKALAELANARGVQLFFDSTQAFGCAANNIRIGNFGRAEVFSFHATHILSATEGGCICTQDDDLAARLQNMRSSAGAGKPVDVTKTVNGRMSEAQAAIALMSLEDFPANQRNNECLYLHYEKHLSAIPGIDLVKPNGVGFSNYQNLVCVIDEPEFGLSTHLLLAVLQKENINAQRCFHLGLHRALRNARDLSCHKDNCPDTDRLCASCIQLPIGAAVSASAVERICDILLKIHHASAVIRLRLK